MSDQVPRSELSGEQLRAAYEAPGVEVPAPKPESKLVRYLRDLAMVLLGAVVTYVQQNGLPF